MSDETFSYKAWSSFFYQVIPLHEESLSWEDISKLAPLLPRGWFELSQLSSQDRIDFTLQFWLSKLSFLSNKGLFLEERLVHFFHNMENIDIFLTQETAFSAFDVHMIYSQKEEIAFFHGSPPAQKDTLANLIKQFETVRFPQDYLGFFAIHDGFSKYRDLGLISTKEMAKSYVKFQEDIFSEIILSPHGTIIDPTTLIPFYESELPHAYRCFYTDWFPEDEIGNISYSLQCKDAVRMIHEGACAYPSFISWFLDYLEERCTE